MFWLKNNQPQQLGKDVLRRMLTTDQSFGIMTTPSIKGSLISLTSDALQSLVTGCATSYWGQSSDEKP